MPKYMVLYRSSVDPTEQMASGSPEDAAQAMQLWMEWAERAGSSLQDMGSPLGKSRLVPLHRCGIDHAKYGFDACASRNVGFGHDAIDDRAKYGR